MRLILFGLGFMWMKSTKLQIRDVFADYEPVQDTTIAPMVVSNHVSFADMFFFLSKNVSFLSKEAVAHIPLIGWHCTARQSIYLNREDNKDRDKVLENIRKRCERVRQHGDVAPLMIFPEGTVTNGRTLMSFKKGPFVNGDPIKIYVVKYNTDSQMAASIININPLFAFIINVTQFWNTLELMEYEDHFDPEWVYKKYGLKKEDPHAWEKVASETKKLMQFISGYGSTEDSYRETLEFEEKSLELGGKARSTRSSRNSKNE